MNYLLAFLGLLIAFAVLRLALIVVGLALLIALLVSFVMRPGHTLLCLCTLVVLALIGAHPMTCIIILGAVGLVVVLLGARPKPTTLLLLTDQRDRR